MSSWAPWTPCTSCPEARISWGIWALAGGACRLGGGEAVAAARTLASVEALRGCGELLLLGLSGCCCCWAELVPEFWPDPPELLPELLPPLPLPPLAVLLLPPLRVGEADVAPPPPTPTPTPGPDPAPGTVGAPAVAGSPPTLRFNGELNTEAANP